MNCLSDTFSKNLNFLGLKHEKWDYFSFEAASIIFVVVVSNKVMNA